MDKIFLQYNKINNNKIINNNNNNNNSIIKILWIYKNLKIYLIMINNNNNKIK